MPTSRREFIDVPAVQEDCEGWLSKIGLATLFGAVAQNGSDRALAAPRDRVSGAAITPFPMVRAKHKTSASIFQEHHVGPNSPTRIESYTIENEASAVSEGLSMLADQKIIMFSDVKGKYGNAAHNALTQIFPWLKHDNMRLVYVTDFDAAGRGDHMEEAFAAYNAGGSGPRDFFTKKSNLRLHLDGIFEDSWIEFQAVVFTNDKPYSVRANPTEVQFVDLLKDGSPPIGVHRRGLSKAIEYERLGMRPPKMFIAWISGRNLGSDTPQKQAYNRAHEILQDEINLGAPDAWFRGIMPNAGRNHAPDTVLVPAYGVSVTAWSVYPDNSVTDSKSGLLKGAFSDEALALFAKDEAIKNLEESLINALANNFGAGALEAFEKAMMRASPDLTEDEVQELSEDIFNLYSDDIGELNPEIRELINANFPEVNMDHILSELPERMDMLIQKTVLGVMRRIEGKPKLSSAVNWPTTPVSGIEDHFGDMTFADLNFRDEVRRYYMFLSERNINEARKILDDIRKQYGKRAADITAMYDATGETISREVY